MKNVIAYSLWGDHPMYWKGALRNIELAKKYFPRWICRFYVDDSCRQELIDTLVGENVLNPTECFFALPNLDEKKRAI